MISDYKAKEMLSAKYGQARFKLQAMGLLKPNVFIRKIILEKIGEVLGATPHEKLLDEFLRYGAERQYTARRGEYRMPLELRKAAERARQVQPETISVNGKVRYIYHDTH